MAEKKIELLPQIRVTDTLLAHLNRLAAHDDRSLSDYVRRTLESHVFGHGFILPASADECEQVRATHCKSEGKS